MLLLIHEEINMLIAAYYFILIHNFELLIYG